MIIIGAYDHPGFQQIVFVDTDSGKFQERRLATLARKRKTLLRARGPGDAGASGGLWKPAGRRAGFGIDRSLESDFSCGSETSGDSGRNEARQKKTDRLRSQLICSCCWKIASRRSGYRAQKSRPAATRRCTGTRMRRRARES